MRNLQNLYFLVLFLFIIPSLNLNFIYTHGISKLLLTFLFINILFTVVYKKNVLSSKEKTLFFLFIINFLSQVFSIIPSISINFFLSRFKDSIFIGIFFIVGIFLSFSKTNSYSKWFVTTLIIASLFNIFFQILIFFYPSFFIDMAIHLFYPGYLDLIVANIQRKRVYFISFDEILIPLCFYYVVKANDKKTKFFYIFYIFLILLISFFSNFRTKLSMDIFALVASIILYRRYLKKFLFLLFLSLFIFFYTNSFYLNQRLGFSLIDRFLLVDEARDVTTILKRKEQAIEGIQIGMSSPIFGVGLGNYLFYISKKFSPFLNKESKALEEGAILPHNIFILTFAETGLIGIISFLFLLLFFLKNDLVILTKKDFLKKSVVISFWTLFIYALFNPTTSIQFNIIFWALRIFLN